MGVVWGWKIPVSGWMTDTPENACFRDCMVANPHLPESSADAATNAPTQRGGSAKVDSAVHENRWNTAIFS